MLQYNAIFADGRFGRVELGELMHRGGAAGKIFFCTNTPLVAKIFHDRSRSANNRAKLQSMMLNRPALPPAVSKDGKTEYVQIAWPEALLEDDGGFCVGYLMPFIHMDEAVSLDHLMQKAVRRKLGLPEKYAYRVFAAYNVAAMAKALHSKGHYIVDMKPSNVSVYKDNMMVAMVDCDGFSIQGEGDKRYPAEFVSEEYIYPEGMALEVAEMGEEQDRFALAVIVFRLLNNGIHPFSGAARRGDTGAADAAAMTIQQRIEGHHYAYGLFPDDYQAPHPYSIHGYFDKRTLELFERAFAKGAESGGTGTGKRPSAAEWQEHLQYLLNHLKACKKNPEHSYFTSKGCGLCLAEQAFSGNMAQLRAKLGEAQTVRGVEVSELSEERGKARREMRGEQAAKLRYVSLAIIALYASFFTFLFLIAGIWQEPLAALGFGLQAAGIVAAAMGLDWAVDWAGRRLPFFGRREVAAGLKIYAVLCMAVAYFYINTPDFGFLRLAE